MDEQFPRIVWKLAPSYQPKEITVTGKETSYYGTYYSVLDGADISASNIWPTRAEAIAAGHSRLDEQLAVLAKKRTNIDKRRAALTKAALADI